MRSQVKKKVSVFRLNLSTNMANDAAAAAFKLETEKEWRNCMLHEPGQSFVKHFRQPFSIYGYSKETNCTVKRESMNSKVMLQSEQACRSLSFLIPFVLMSISSVSTCQWFVVFQMWLKLHLGKVEHVGGIVSFYSVYPRVLLQAITHGVHDKYDGGTPPSTTWIKFNKKRRWGRVHLFTYEWPVTLAVEPK